MTGVIILIMKNNKGFAPIVIVLIIVALLAVGGGLYYSGKNSNPVYNESNNQGVNPLYQPQDQVVNPPVQNPTPTNISTTLPQYISGQSGWPPVIQNSTNTYSCMITSSAGQDGPAPTTTEKVINGKTYCIKVMMEAAAGSRYGTYTYTTANGSGTKTTNFTLRWPNCDNYDDPENTQCKTNQNTFFGNLDTLIANLL